MSEIRVGRRTIQTSSETRVLFPKDGITKGDIIAYYRAIAPWMVPHLKSRRLSMERFHPDIYAQPTFQKNMPGHFPDWVNRVTVPKRGGTVDHVVCDNAETLVYLANQGCLTPHVGLARIDRIDHPDQLFFDLDPAKDDFDSVRSVAFAMRELLDEIRLVSFLKTTGSKGLHIVVPLDRKLSFDEARSIARQIAEILVQRRPKDTTLEFYKDQRAGKIFIDTNRNGTAQTAVPAFAVRARDGAPVAMPITWEELADPKLGARTYTIRNAVERMQRTRDPMRAMARAARSLRPAANRLAKLV
jgi:bifunctional non-homologous end joining protein LigD